jgi:hypothetical protein
LFQKIHLGSSQNKLGFFPLRLFLLFFSLGCFSRFVFCIAFLAFRNKEQGKFKNAKKENRGKFSAAAKSNILLQRIAFAFTHVIFFFAQGGGRLFSIPLRQAFRLPARFCGATQLTQNPRAKTGQGGAFKRGVFSTGVPAGALSSSSLRIAFFALSFHHAPTNLRSCLCISCCHMHRVLSTAMCCLLRIVVGDHLPGSRRAVCAPLGHA